MCLEGLAYTEGKRKGKNTTERRVHQFGEELLGRATDKKPGWNKRSEGVV